MQETVVHLHNINNCSICTLLLQAKDVGIELHVFSPVGQCRRQHVSHSLKLPQDDEGAHSDTYTQGICIGFNFEYF